MVVPNKQKLLQQNKSAFENIKKRHKLIYNKVCSKDTVRLRRLLKFLTMFLQQDITTWTTWILEAGPFKSEALHVNWPARPLREPMEQRGQTAQVETNQVVDTWRKKNKEGGGGGRGGRGSSRREKHNKHFDPEAPDMKMQLPQSGGKDSTVQPCGDWKVRGRVLKLSCRFTVRVSFKHHHRLRWPPTTCLHNKLITFCLLADI